MINLSTSELVLNPIDMKKILAFPLALLFLQLTAQVDFGEPEIDDNIIQSKPYKRHIDYAAKRKTDDLNPDWIRWEAWQKAKGFSNKAIQDEVWENHGPDTVSGRIISIAFHPWDAETMLVGSASGGLWRTTNYGESWEILTDNYFTMGIGAVAYNPLNPNSILIATGEGYSFGGEFTSGYGVMISHDGGSTWNNTSITASLDQSFAGMDIHWNYMDTTKVCIASSFGMYYSSDGGLHYEYVLDRLGGRMMADPDDPYRLYFTARYYNATYPGGLYISDNSGETWILQTGTGLPSPDAFGYASIAIHPIYNNIIFVSVSRSPVYGTGPLEGLYKSSNFGASFTEIVPSLDYLCYHPPYQNICQGWFAHTIQVSPSDTNHLFGGGCRLWSSFDGGINWEAIDLNPSGTYYDVHPDHHQTWFHPLTGDLIDCNDAGVNISHDAGETWINISNGLVTHQFYSISSAQTNPDVVLGGTQDAGTFSSTTAHSGGWNNDVSGDSFGQAIDHTNAYTWYGTNFMNWQRMKTLNAGETWFPINNGTSGADQWRMPIVMHPTDNQILLSSNNNYMYKTSNGGNHWEVVSNNGYIGTFEYDKINTDLIYAHRLYGNIVYRSTDGGENWSTLSSSPGTPITDLATDPSRLNMVYATIGSFNNNDQLFVSDDQGTTWTNISNDLPEVPCNSVAVSTYNSEEIYVGTDIGVWKSIDGGSSWESFNEGLPAAVVVDDLHYYAPDTSVRIGTYGRGYWRVKVSATMTGIQPALTDQQVWIFPNVVANKLSIRSRDIIMERVEIYNQTGQLAKQLITDTRMLTVDVTDFNPGIYIVKVFSSNQFHSLKMIKQ